MQYYRRITFLYNFAALALAADHATQHGRDGFDIRHNVNKRAKEV